MDKDKVLKLAKLARIDISAKEAESLSKEFSMILEYVGEVKGAAGKTSKEAKDYVKNVLRADELMHDAGKFTEKILKQTPKREGNYVKVKKIL